MVSIVSYSMIENPCEPMKNCHSGVGIPPFLDKARMATSPMTETVRRRKAKKKNLGMVIIPESHLEVGIQLL
jgi:hypothetical protein